MTKNQKIWFAVFLAMFLVPEVLWGGVRWIIFNVFFPIKNTNWLAGGILPDVENNLLGSIVSQIQFIGLIGLSYIFLKSKINLFIKIVVGLILISLIFFTGILAWMGFYYLSHSPQIG